MRLLPYAVALALVASLLPVTVVVLIHTYGVNGAVAGVLATAQTAPLLMAVSRPLQAWWIVFAADVLGALATMDARNVHDAPWPWTPMVVIGYAGLMLAVGLREQRRTLLGVWLVTGAAGFAFQLAPPSTGQGTHLVMFVLSGVVLLVTGMLREHGDAQRRLVEQETISEAERARRTLLEERARIARELHDVVAHHMSVITVQADSAPYRIEGLPPAASEEFSAIAASARESLTEMRRLLAVLRSENAEGERAPAAGHRPGAAVGGGDHTGRGAGRAAARGGAGPRTAGGGPVRVPDRAGGAGQRGAARAGCADAGVGVPLAQPGMADRPGRQRGAR